MSAGVPGRRHTLPDTQLSGEYKNDVQLLRDLLRNTKDGFSGLPAPHHLTHRVGQEDPLPTPGTPRTILVGGSASIGSGPSYMREDAQLVVGAGVPVGLGLVAAEGTSSLVARADHVHPRPDPLVARPAQITASQNNYSLGKVHVAFLDLSADWSVTGLLATGIPDGWQMEVWNISAAFVLTVTHEDVASAAANRQLGQGSANITINPGFAGSFTYDLTAQRWRGREE